MPVKRDLPSRIIESPCPSTKRTGTPAGLSGSCNSSGVHQVLDVPLSPRDGTLDHSAHVESGLARKRDNSVDRFASFGLVANDPAFADLTLAHFELRFDQRHQLATQKLG